MSGFSAGSAVSVISGEGSDTISEIFSITSASEDSLFRFNDW